MADIQKPVRDILIEEGPRAVALGKDLWESIASRPALQDLLKTVDITPSSTGKIVLTPKAGESPAALAQMLKKEAGVGAPPPALPPSTGTANALVPSSPGGAGPVPLPSSTPTMPSPPGGGFGAPPPPGALPPSPAGQPPLGDVMAGKQGMSTGAKVGIGLGTAGALGAGYAATQGAGEQSASGAPQGAGDSSSTTSTTSQPQPTPEPTKPTREPMMITGTQIQKPAAFNELVNQAESEVKALEGKQSDWTDKDEAGFTQRAGDLRKLYAEARNRAEWAEVAEKFGHALTQLFAARQGMREGVNMSGVKFQPSDWARRYDTLLNDLKMDLGLLKEEKEGKQAIIKDARSAIDAAKKKRDAAKQASVQADLEVAGKNASSKDAAARSNQSTRTDYDRMDADAEKTDKTIAGADRRAALQRIGAAIKEDAKKQETVNRVIGLISRSTNPDSLSDKNMKEAQKLYISAGLGEIDDFEGFLDGVDTRGWQSDSTMKQRWEQTLRQKLGMPGTAPTTPPPPGGGDAKTEVRRQINRELKKTRIFYKDGSTTELDGIHEK